MLFRSVSQSRYPGQLLVRSRFLLFKTPNKWGESQKQRAEHSNSVEVFQTELELHTDQDLELLLKSMHRLEHMARDKGNLFEKVIHRTLACRNM